MPHPLGHLVRAAQPLIARAQEKEQAPPEHEGAPLFALQALPQAPQWSGLTAVLTSQPLGAIPSQFANVPVHEATWQEPDGIWTARPRVRERRRGGGAGRWP